MCEELNPCNGIKQEEGKNKRGKKEREGKGREWKGGEGKKRERKKKTAACGTKSEKKFFFSIKWEKNENNRREKKSYLPVVVDNK